MIYGYITQREAQRCKLSSLFYLLHLNPHLTSDQTYYSSDLLAFLNPNPILMDKCESLCIHYFSAKSQERLYFLFQQCMSYVYRKHKA